MFFIVRKQFCFSNFETWAHFEMLLQLILKNSTSQRTIEIRSKKRRKYIYCLLSSGQGIRFPMGFSFVYGVDNFSVVANESVESVVAAADVVDVVTVDGDVVAAATVSDVVVSVSDFCACTAQNKLPLVRCM